ncbi:hypothetical protein HDN1F_09010 [gamma proteobacterium HdN1]|nr:hypothetical protein HDN1F_09010 [gamma proteobacterium HdN1]
MNKKNNFRFKLSTKLFLAIMGASLCMGFILTLAQISIDYNNTRTRLTALGTEAVQTMQLPIAEVAKAHDIAMARSILEDLFRKTYLIEISITTQRGETLAHLSRPRSTTRFTWLSDLAFGKFRSFEIPLQHTEQGKTIPLGALSLVLDTSDSGGDFIARTFTTLFAGMLQATGFGLILYAIIHGLITRPLSQLILSIDEIDARRLGTRSLQIPQGHQNDEIGVWVRKFNQMLEAIGDYSRYRRLAEANVERLSNYDTLTELPNRSLFLKRLDALNQPLTSDHYSALFYIGLDDFSSVNLLHSYRTGDRVLTTLADRLRKSTPDQALLMRAGGDQFCIAIRGTSEPQARELAHALLALVQQPFSGESTPLTLSATVGVAFFPRDAKAPELLLKKAEEAMRLGKSAGGNSIQFYSEIENHRQKASKQLERDLLTAVESSQLSLMFQPQIDLASGQIVGVEALLRWDHPQRGLISPDEFILLAESNRAVIPIGHWVLKNACKTLAEWHKAGYPDLGMSINLSAIQLHHPPLASDLAHIITEYGLPPASLTFEITESSVMENIEHAIDVLKNIRKLGVHLAIDDFGTGYSSLSYLRRMPIDEVKLDRSFFLDLDRDTHADSVKIIEAVIRLGHSLGLEIVAEGTESAAHVELLQRCGCDRSQGFYYSEPLEADKFLALMHGERKLRAPTPNLSPNLSAPTLHHS